LEVILTRGLNANIDEVRVWSGVKTQAQLVANSMTKYSGTEPGLLAYYSLPKETNNLYDTTTSDNTAIVLNADTNGLGLGKF
jgi:hypothetical protein